MSAEPTRPLTHPSAEPAVRQLSSLARVARQRIRHNLASRPQVEEIVPVLPPIEVDSLPAPVARRAEAALLIASILELRPDLNGEVGIPTSPMSWIEPDLLHQVDQIIARQRDNGETNRIALINAILRDWLTANERVTAAASAR